MPISYESVVPWGRSYDEYVSMFALTDRDLAGTVLGCGDGPAAFNADLTARGGRVVSVDPIYRFTRGEIERRIKETRDKVVEQTERNLGHFLWTKFKDLDHLVRVRLGAMARFLEDFEKGKAEGRYREGELPDLPSFDGRFSLALSSHFLFFYSDNLTYEFHEKSIDAMLDAADEARIFPIVDLNLNRSPYLGGIVDRYRGKGYAVEERRVDYEFQKGGDRMLTIRASG